MRRLPLALAATALLVLAPAAAASAAPTPAPGCDVTSAELTWGFKESFRAYIDGSIANGQWTVADGASYDTPLFGFVADTGRIDPRATLGRLDFTGSVRFTGHGGILDTRIANPALVFDGSDTALLLLDVTGPTMDGDHVSATATPFVQVDLDGQNLTPVDGVITISDAATTLTAEGAIAFPNYEPLTAFDPVTVTIDVGDCDLTGQPIGGDLIDAPPTADPWPILAVGAATAAVAVAVTAVVLTRRRRTLGA